MIPLKIDTLLAGRVVEQNRVEDKEGWNPGDIIHSICAFANDYHNMNGGYLVIGVKANDGILELPPKGLPLKELDSVQQEIFQYCNQIVQKQGTGIPKILRELKKNGSPEPEFEMDTDRTYLNTVIHIRDGFKINAKMSDKEKMFYSLILQVFENSAYVTTKIMSEVTGMAESTTRRYLNKFCDWEIIKSDGKNRGTKYLN